MNIKKIWPLALLLLLIMAVATAYSIDKYSAPNPTLSHNETWIKGVAIVGDPQILEVDMEYSIIWDSKNVKTVTIALEKDGQYVKNLIWNLENNGGAVWTPDRSLQPGENYQIVITDITNLSKPIYYKSKNFAIEAYRC